MGVPRRTRKISSDDNMNLSVRRSEGQQDRKIVHQSTRTVESLPKDLLVDVFARVASSSFDDLFNIKFSCKDFEESTKDDYIYQRISIDKFPITHWCPRPQSERVISFLTHCLIKGNSESLFRKGMVDYFKLGGDVESGLKYLKRAAENGHSEATYVYGMILISSGDQTSQQGLNLLNSMNQSRSRHWNLQKCRDKITCILNQMWIKNPINLEKVNTECKDRDHAIRFRRRGWSFDEDEEISRCDTCLWYRELIYLCRIMNVSV